MGRTGVDTPVAVIRAVGPHGRGDEPALVGGFEHGGAGAVAGRDRNGPTALLNSVLKLPLSRAAGTPVLNLRFQKDTLADESGLAALAGLILLVAMIGAIVLTLRHRVDIKRQNVVAQMMRDPAKAMELRDVKPGQGL